MAERLFPRNILHCRYRFHRGCNEPAGEYKRDAGISILPVSQQKIIRLISNEVSRIFLPGEKRNVSRSAGQRVCIHGTAYARSVSVHPRSDPRGQTRFDQGSSRVSDSGLLHDERNIIPFIAGFRIIELCIMILWYTASHVDEIKLF